MRATCVLHARRRAERDGLRAGQKFVNKLPRRTHVLKPGLMERRDYRLLTERQHELLKRYKWKRVQDTIFPVFLHEYPELQACTRGVDERI
jgi:hypothetical protein